MKLTLKIFTRRLPPPWRSRGGAAKAAWELKERKPDLFVLLTLSLTGKAGLDEAQAQAQKIKTIPTMILSRGERGFDRIAGVPATGDLEKLINTAITEEA